MPNSKENLVTVVFTDHDIIYLFRALLEGTQSIDTMTNTNLDNLYSVFGRIIEDKNVTLKSINDDKLIEKIYRKDNGAPWPIIERRMELKGEWQTDRCHIQYEGNGRITFDKMFMSLLKEYLLVMSYDVIKTKYGKCVNKFVDTLEKNVGRFWEDSAVRFEGSLWSNVIIREGP